MIVVTTPTGQIGSQVVRRLLDHGSAVRVIVRDASRLDGAVRERVEIVEGSHDDSAVLDQALPEADAVFWLVPPNPHASSAAEHYLNFARAGAAAIARHEVGHVVGAREARGDRLPDLVQGRAQTGRRCHPPGRGLTLRDQAPPDDLTDKEKRRE
jgi:uncharacterized protein YbjT (DUF2867 family)